MTEQRFEERYEMYRLAVENALEGLLVDRPHWADLYEAMRYSLLSGGKRLRPILALEFARVAGGAWEDALPVACAVEMVHTYSLIHDDLPCMDDDDLRRGKPSSHKAYGEAMAILAGDALQPAAYELILGSEQLPQKARLECALLLAQASGPSGMVAGQVLDTIHAPGTETELAEVHRLKTGYMIRAACTMGCAVGDASPALREAASIYAENLGMAFQIRDDMLDVIGNADAFGKPIGSDREEGKITFVDLLGLEGCEKEVLACTERAKDAVAAYDEDGFLAMLADFLTDRMK